MTTEHKPHSIPEAVDALINDAPAKSAERFAKDALTLLFEVSEYLSSTQEQLEAAQGALEREAAQRIKDCDDRNAYKRRADIAEGVLRQIADSRLIAHSDSLAVYAAICELARHTIASNPASEPKP